MALHEFDYYGSLALTGQISSSVSHQTSRGIESNSRFKSNAGGDVVAKREAVPRLNAAGVPGQKVANDCFWDARSIRHQFR